MYKNDSSSSFLLDAMAYFKKIGIEWLIEKDTIRIQYQIERIYISRNYNSINNKTTENLNLLSFDNDNYPLLLLVPIENRDFLYIYYFWNNKADVFQKSEKIMITSNELLHFTN